MPDLSKIAPFRYLIRANMSGKCVYLHEPSKCWLTQASGASIFEFAPGFEKAEFEKLMASLSTEELMCITNAEAIPIRAQFFKLGFGRAPDRLL